MKDFFIAQAIHTVIALLEGLDKDNSAVRKWGHLLIPLRDALDELYPKSKGI